MQLEQHLAGFREAVDAFADSATTAGLETAVPTTPDWDVRRLVAHQGLIHRWATGHLLAEEVDVDETEHEGVTAADPVDWLREGADRLVSTLIAAPDDLSALVFLADAPAPRQFWARRQCHETTIHAVDALSARLGRYPRAADTWIGRELALDGIDELLTGFLPRPRSQLRTDEPLTIAILPEDAEQRWLVALSPQPPVTARGLGDEEADVLLRGSAVALYLTLWNRSDEVSDESLDLWAEAARVTWG
ncbi:MAG TPA: maleylpyruvate isomerase family mycothiol-dependent enzyme [Nocardioides sp.]|uniref:maleylpyruvate isomerase family mycothiol-dependent enzyme n=1 Tax=Nocardioides sp. TaxID=35761 RepID=UPI002F3E8A1D